MEMEGVRDPHIDQIASEPVEVYVSAENHRRKPKVPDHSGCLLSVRDRTAESQSPL